MIREKLEINDDLCKLAQEHADDLGKHGLTNHTGSKGLTPTQRAQQASITTIVFENLSFGDFDTPQECVLNLLIDDGVKSRLHRDNLMKKNIN